MKLILSMEKVRHTYILSKDSNIINAIVHILDKHSKCMHFDDVSSLINQLNPNSIVVCDCDYIDCMRNHIQLFAANNIDCVIIFDHDLSKEHTRALFEYGLVAAFNINRCELIPYYCDNFLGLNTGTIGIIDGSENTIFGLSTVINKFGYLVKRYQSLDEWCNKVEEVDILCINCSQEGPEKIARKHLQGAFLPKSCIVVYQKEEKDIYVHDLIRLKKLVKAVYTLQEVYVMFAHLLFTQQLHRYIYGLYQEAGMNTSTTSYRGSLRQWYLEKGVSIFRESFTIENKLLNNFADSVYVIQLLLARGWAFKWMWQKEKNTLTP